MQCMRKVHAVNYAVVYDASLFEVMFLKDNGVFMKQRKEEEEEEDKNQTH